MKIPAAKAKAKNFAANLRAYLNSRGVDVRNGSGEYEIFQARMPGGNWLAFCRNSAGDMTTPSAFELLIHDFLASNCKIPSAPSAPPPAGKNTNAFRDELAMLAAECMLPNYQQILEVCGDTDPQESGENVHKTLKAIAHFSYAFADAFADAMLAARDK